jgi:hypothetical protein
VLSDHFLWLGPATRVCLHSSALIDIDSKWNYIWKYAKSFLVPLKTDQLNSQWNCFSFHILWVKFCAGERKWGMFLFPWAQIYANFKTIHIYISDKDTWIFNFKTIELCPFKIWIWLGSSLQTALAWYRSRYMYIHNIYKNICLKWLWI